MSSNLEERSRLYAVEPEKTYGHTISIELGKPPKGAVTIKAYGNTNFVHVMLEKQFYKQLEETAKKLESTPGKLIYNAILLIIKSLKQ